jgi:hypothetical protein
VPDLVLKQLVAVVDSRTTMICLACNGQIKAVSEPFDTLNGPIDEPPFHVHCRSMSVPWMRGMVSGLRAEANAEILRRPLAQRRFGPGGYQGKLPPRPRATSPEAASGVDEALGPDVSAFAADEDVQFLPPDVRASFILAHPERFVPEANGGGISHTYWVTDKVTKTRWVLKRGEYHAGSVNEVVSTELANRVGLLRSQVIRAGPVEADGNGWVLIRHAEDVEGSRYKVVGTGGGHAKIAKLGPKLADPTDAVRVLVHDFVVDEADAKGGNMLLLSDDAGKTVRLQPIDRSLSLMGWRGAVEPGQTRVTAGDWSLAGRLKVSSLREYMKTRGSPKGVHDLVQTLAEDPATAKKLVAAYDDTVAKLSAVNVEDLVVAHGQAVPGYAEEAAALIRRRIELLQTERSRMLAQMGLKDTPAAPLVENVATVDLRKIGQEYLYSSEKRSDGQVYARYWEGDYGKTTLKDGPLAAQTAQLEVEIGRMVDRFPVMDRLSRVEWGEPKNDAAWAMYFPGSQRLKLSARAWTDMAGAHAQAVEYARAGWWVPVSEAAPEMRGVLTHELGHFLDDMSRKAFRTPDTDELIEAFDTNVGAVEFKHVAPEVLDDVYLPQIETMWERIGVEMARTSTQAEQRTLTAAQAFDEKNVALYAKRVLSRYGGRNRHEFVAEAFSEYMTSNSPRPVARIVGETFEEIFGKPSAVAAKAVQEAEAAQVAAVQAEVVETAVRGMPYELRTGWTPERLKRLADEADAAGAKDLGGILSMRSQSMAQMQRYLTNDAWRTQVERWAEELRVLARREDQHVWSTVSTSRVEKLIKDGRFKSAWEVKTSRPGGAKKYMVNRKFFETEAVGVPEAEKAHPVYGWVGAAPGDADVSEYGWLHAQLDDAVKARTTTTFDDSLNYGLEPMMLNDVADASLEQILASRANGSLSYTLNMATGETEFSSYTMKQGFAKSMSYQEAQVHGGLALDEVKKFVYERSKLKKEAESLGANPKLTGNVPVNPEAAKELADLDAAVALLRAHGFVVEEI